ncbi:uncharacterized protein LOC121236967 isoform X1 [Juglans microcarpa x Juglans regia]|uniref:uncharacterized protein LOC121236967 isoform X1 n=2 Tax=Juglans microcarpa x Juglans regia TaxID=2249226 RepID=UPI001B7E4D29|nr:uncharacterized protein LOC121236967 isoform X1 [Juglans microcarpa x Juglans regia]
MLRRDTPMDYDDNEFQSQNLHLAGEGNTKFPPVLRPYALPKFDFDDSLQGHLRFDSLVETEVFLGIESNEDNQWIEDFSRGSSGIEFNSSATESCTIARRNNVWSEATSSESVEMLLKSVGQEEIILTQTIVKESNACDELGCLVKQMEPNPVLDNNICRTGDITNLQSTLLQNENPENSSGLKGDVLEEQPHVEDTSLSHEVAFSVGGTSGELDPNAINRSDVDTLAEEYLNDKTCKDSSDSVMQVGSIVAYTEDIIASGSEVNNEDLLHQFNDLSNMNSNGVETGNDGIGEEFHPLSREAEIADQNLNGDAVESSTSHSESHLGLNSKLESVEEGNATGNRTSNVAEPSSMVDNSDSDLHVAERCLEDAGIRIPDEAMKHDLVLVKDTNVCDPSKVNTQEVSPLTIKDDTNHEGYAVQVRNFKGLLTHGQESSGEKDDLLESGCQLDNEVLATKSEALLLSMENHKVSKVEGDPNNNSHEGGTSSVSLVCSSPELHKETHETESLKEIHNGFGVSREDLIAEDHVLSSSGNESSQTCGEEKNHGKSGVPEGDIDVSVCANGSTKLPSNFSSAVGGSLIIDKGVGSSFFCEGSAGNEPIISKLQFDANVGNESASNAILENAKVASSDTMSGVLLPSDNGMTADGVIDCREVQMTASVVGYTHSDKKEPPATKISTDASISILMESSEVENELGPVSETEKDASYDSAGKVSQETVDGSLPMAETCNAESQSEAQMAVTVGVNQECPRRMEVRAVIHDIATKVGDFENTPSKVSGDVYKVHEGSLSSALLPESQNDLCALESVSASANVDKHTGSSNITRTTEQSQRENENEQEKASKEEGINGPTDQNAPVSEVIDVDASNILPISGDSKRNDTFEQEQNFTFEISSLADLSRKDTAKNSQPFPFIRAGKVTPIVEGSPSTSGLVPMEAKISRDISNGSPQVSEGQITRGGKSSGERKTRRRSGKETGKETAKKGNHVKETTPARQSERGDKSTNVSLSPSAIFQFVQSGEMQHYGHVEGSNTKPIFVLTASTSNLPDLNTSASPSTMFQQPFTDLQQVQLRAQIFVYGALIQGTVPEEAHMISAFGGPDGGKSIWENAWRACAEKLHIHKSQPITPETPLQLRPGVRALEQAIKQNAFQSKGISSPLGRTSSKGIPTVVNSAVALSSPLWSIPTPCDALQSSVMPRGSIVDYQQTLSPLHPYQTPPVRNFVGHNTSWIPQVPFRGPWMASPQTSAPDATTHISVLPNAEIIKSTPIRESFMPHTSAIKHVSAGPMVQSGVPTSAPLLDPKEVIVSPRQNSTDPKSRRRKKTPVSADPGQFVLQSQSQPKPVSSPAVISHLSTSVSVTTPTGFASKATSEKFIISEPALSSTDILKRAGQDVEQPLGQGAALSEETLRKVKEARLQAEDAAALSADAVSHSHKIWSQMEKQKNSGLVADVEAKLSSAAVAIAAAAAVAKAAAAAANVASNAALQAQLMAEEALVSNGNDDPSQCNGASLPDSVDILGKATPASILMGENGTNSSGSIITVAKEAVRKRADSASAAAKRAENMDAIVKAAELAAEAISQAGKIVAMGDSLPLSELLEAGPGGYWKVSRDSSELVLKASNMNREQLNSDSVRGGPDTSTKHSKEGRLDKKVAQSTTLEKSPITTEMPKGSMEDHMRLADGFSGIVTANEKDSRGQKGRRAFDLAKTIGVVPESEIGSRPSITVRNEYEKAAENFKLSCIKEGSLVEVLKSTDGFKAAWFTANVLNLDDGKAYVSYTELQTDNGEGQLKEYVALQGEGDKPPRIRAARPVTALRYEGTRKRRRAAMGDYNWSVGDRVDALIEDSWREGVVTEKNKKDETTLNVHFPAHGETSVVRAWHLRPSFIWKDGEWVEWSNLRENVCTSHEGDTPKEKRLKLGSPVTEAKGKGKVFKSRDVVESGKLEESRLLDLSATDKIFNVGKNSRNENKPDALRTLRSGLQKERSRVIFGVPKPGKKRKFMEVSKHYVADQSNKITEANDSVKFQKYTMPRGSGSRGWKNSSKNDLKEKQRAETKPRALKSGKAQSLSGRIIPAKDNLLSAVSAPDDATLADLSAKDKDSASHAENASGKNNKLEIGSLSSAEGTTEGPLLFSSLAPSSDGSSRKVSTLNAKSVRVNKGKIASAGGKLARIEEDKVFNGNPAKSASGVVEPRRSNRRIQPTSRLLEGLQSSLTISKIPSVSHDKGHKSLIRTASRGSNHG